LVLPAFAAFLVVFLALAAFSPQLADGMRHFAKMTIQMVVPGDAPVGFEPDVDPRTPGETLEDWSSDAEAIGAGWTANYNKTVDDMSSGWNSFLNMVISLVYGFYFNWFLGLVVIFVVATSVGLVVSWTSKMGKLGLIMSVIGVVIYIVALIAANEQITAGLGLPYIIWAAFFMPTYLLKRSQMALFSSIGAFVVVVAWIQFYPSQWAWAIINWEDFMVLYIPDVGVGYISPSASVVGLIVAPRLALTAIGASRQATQPIWLPEIPRTAEEWWQFFDYSYTNMALFAAKSTIFLVGIVASLVMVVFAVRYQMKDKHGQRNTFLAVVSLVAMVAMWLVLYQSWRLLAQGLVWHLVAALVVLGVSVVYSRKVAAHSERGAKMPRAILSVGAFLAWFVLLSLCVWMTYLPYYVPWRGGWPVTSLF